MQKPWVVYLLLWTYRVGLLLTFGAAMRIGWIYNRDPLRSGRWRAALWTGCLSGATALAGWLLGYGTSAMVFGLICYASCEVLLVVDTRSAWSLGYLPLLVFVLGIFAVFNPAIIQSTQREDVPQWERRLSDELVCRGYRKWHDSIPVTRLVLMRDTPHAFKAAIVEEVEGPYLTDCLSCSIEPDGSVLMKVRECSGDWETEKRVAVSPER